MVSVHNYVLPIIIMHAYLTFNYNVPHGGASHYIFFRMRGPGELKIYWLNSMNNKIYSQAPRPPWQKHTKNWIRHIDNHPKETPYVQVHFSNVVGMATMWKRGYVVYNLYYISGFGNQRHSHSTTQQGRMKNYRPLGFGTFYLHAVGVHSIPKAMNSCLRHYNN